MVKKLTVQENGLVKSLREQNFIGNFGFVITLESFIILFMTLSYFIFGDYNKISFCFLCASQVVLTFKIYELKDRYRGEDIVHIFNTHSQFQRFHLEKRILHSSRILLLITLAVDTLLIYPISSKEYGVDFVGVTEKTIFVMSLIILALYYFVILFLFVMTKMKGRKFLLDFCISEDVQSPGSIRADSLSVIKENGDSFMIDLNSMSIEFLGDMLFVFNTDETGKCMDLRTYFIGSEIQGLCIRSETIDKLIAYDYDTRGWVAA